MSKIGKDHVYNILFCGYGGQGVLTAAEICGRAAIMSGFHVKMSAVHGMAQRGGSVESHLRFGKSVASPMIPNGLVQWMVCMDENEGQRHLSQLIKGGTDLSGFIKKSDCLKDRRTLNIFMLGILSQYLPIKESYWHLAIKEVLPAQIVQINEEVFEKGRKIWKTNGNVDA